MILIKAKKMKKAIDDIFSDFMEGEKVAIFPFSGSTIFSEMML